MAEELLAKLAKLKAELDALLGPDRDVWLFRVEEWATIKKQFPEAQHAQCCLPVPNLSGMPVYLALDDDEFASIQGRLLRKGLRVGVLNTENADG